jgi:hypothetical protein
VASVVRSDAAELIGENKHVDHPRWRGLAGWRRKQRLDVVLVNIGDLCERLSSIVPMNFAWFRRSCRPWRPNAEFDSKRMAPSDGRIDI